MNKLIFGNLVYRPLRSLLSLTAVAIEVVMIISVTAIMLGMLNDTKTRVSGIGADLIVRPCQLQLSGWRQWRSRFRQSCRCAGSPAPRHGFIPGGGAIHHRKIP